MGRTSTGRQGVPASKQDAAAGPCGDLPPALVALFQETTALFHWLQAASEALHGPGPWSEGLRSILCEIHRAGPQTVPQLARRRPASRQYVQTLVNRLLTEGYVELARNPGHRRSHLVRLTPRGVSFLEAMERREAELLERVPLHVSAEDVRAAAETLRAVRDGVERGRRRLLEQRQGGAA